MYGYKHRLMLDIVYKNILFNKIIFATRTRFQSEIAYPGADKLGYVPEYYWRQKFEFKYQIPNSRFTPYIGTELRIQFSTPHIKEFRDFGFSRARPFAGCDYEINKNSSVGAYYLVQFDFQVNDPRTLYIIGLEYAFTLSYKGKVDYNKSVE